LHGLESKPGIDQVFANLLTTAEPHPIAELTFGCLTSSSSSSSSSSSFKDRHPAQQGQVEKLCR
jgi:hypothetical protein